MSVLLEFNRNLRLILALHEFNGGSRRFFCARFCLWKRLGNNVKISPFLFRCKPARCIVACTNKELFVPLCMRIAYTVYIYIYLFLWEGGGGGVVLSFKLFKLSRLVVSYNSDVHMQPY